jgi:hypothetical protein
LRFEVGMVMRFDAVPKVAENAHTFRLFNVDEERDEIISEVCHVVL